jgi:guanyl-specific ribonuclease Sa
LRRIAILLFLFLAVISCRVQQDQTQNSISSDERTEIKNTLYRISSHRHRYRQDGSTFQNREQRLPEKPYGYYKEYTVETPGSRDRGARRLILGSDGEAYYTNDHYETFVKIDPKDYS